MSASTPARKSRCPRCGSWHDPESAEGLCPHCLAALNLGSETELPASEDALGEPTAAPPPRPPAPSLAEIARHFPQLEILECLGRGGMGIVYRARQPQLNRLVALKILAPEKEREAGFAERFACEAQALARLNHPNVVTIYDFGKVNGLYYLLMEYVDGVSLRQLLQARKITPKDALTIVPRICEALQYAHEHGVVHRDIKPENVLLNQEGRVKIADFGIAKMIDVEAGQPVIANEQQVIGTPHYMAPEQVEHPKEVDHRADIYSLGVVFYEMLTGELPLGKIQPPSRKVQVDVRLDEIVLRALEKEPERRYQHASDVKAAVETLTKEQAQAKNPVLRSRFGWFRDLHAVERVLQHTLSRAAQVKLASILAALFLLAFATVVYLACFFPKQVAVWSAAGRALTTWESILSQVSLLCESFGLFILPLLLAGFITCVFWAVISGWHSSDPRRLALRTGAVLAFLVALLLAGLGLCFLYALSLESGRWHPVPGEAITVLLIWLGGLLLPLAGIGLLRLAAGPAGGFRTRRWLVALAVVVCVAVICAIGTGQSVRKARIKAAAAKSEQLRNATPPDSGSLDLEEPNSRLLKTGAALGEMPLDIAAVPALDLRAGGDENKRYFLIGIQPGTPTPEKGYRLLLVLPGGDGGANFTFFVRRIYKKVLDQGWLVAQLVAPQWDTAQARRLVWPTSTDPYPAARFTTEQFVAAVVEEISAQHPITPAGVFTLSWSSGGPAAYAVSLAPATRVTGSFIVMSVFHPSKLPPLVSAKGRFYYLLHSPQDFIPMKMPQTARDQLQANGALVELQTYEGGHGWHGDVYGHLRRGIDWLVSRAQGAAPLAANAAEAKPDEASQRESASSQVAKDAWRLWQAGRVEEARAKFREAVKLAPEAVDLWNGLGWAAYLAANQREAEMTFQKALALAPNHGAALNGLGRIYLDQKKYDLAETNLLEAARRAPAAQANLAALYLIQGKFEQAERWASNALVSGENDEFVRQLLRAAQSKRVPEELRLQIEPR